MYLIDKLQMVHKTTSSDSVEFILAQYLLNNLQILKKLNLKTICLESGLSKSSIIRFCQKAGYDGFTVFMDELSIEANDLKNTLNSYQQIDLMIYAELRSNFIIQCMNTIKESYNKLIKTIKQSKKIIFYGHEKYISCFSLLTTCLFLTNKQVINNMCWNLEKQETLYTDFDENNLIIIIEPYMSWRSYKELLAITMDASRFIQTTKAKIAFIGQDTNENIDISIALPYTYYETLYKDFFINLDMMLVTDLWSTEEK